MRKLMIVLLLSGCITGNIAAQELTPAYFAQCNEFIRFLRNDQNLSLKTYIWSPRASDTSYFIYEAPQDLTGDEPWKCWQTPCFIGGRIVTDTIQFSQADMDYMRVDLSSLHDTAWRNRLAAATGLLAGEPWVTKNIDDFSAISPPLFLQNATVCVIYYLSESVGYRGCGYQVYKRDANGWAFIANRGGSWRCGYRKRK